MKLRWNGTLEFYKSKKKSSYWEFGGGDQFRDLLEQKIPQPLLLMSSTSFGAYLISGTTYPKLTQNGHCLDRKARIRPTGILSVESWHEIYQYHLEGEIKPFQWVGPQNVQVRPGRLEPLSRTEEFCAMIRAQDIYASKSDLQPLRSVSVQRRAEMPPEPGRQA